MNINRHNYEEFFLMYVDNELSGAQRTEVEVFVKQNPDLSQELELLKESVLVPGEIIFEGKESLYKDEHSININNYEEYFLLDVDNELNELQKNEVEKFVLQHPKLQEEFTLLHQTKLEAEVVYFKGKETLYRTEKKERRVVAMRFTRFAIAASVIGLIATLWIVYPDNNNGIETLASTEQPSVDQPGKVDSQPGTIVTSKNMGTINVSDANEPIVVSQKNIAMSAKAVNSEIKKVPGKRVPLTEMKESENDILAYNNPGQQVIEDAVGRPVEDANIETDLVTQASDKFEKNASFMQPAVYKEANFDEDDEDKSLYIGSVEINKNKLRGLFKKASNLFDKKAKTTDSDKTLQIASFEIKTK